MVRRRIHVNTELRYRRYVMTLFIVILLAAVLYELIIFFRSKAITVTYGIWSGWTMEYYEEGSREFGVHYGSKIYIESLPSLELDAKVLSVDEDKILIGTSSEMIRYDVIDGEETRVESKLHTIRRGEELTLMTPSMDVVANYQIYFK